MLEPELVDRIHELSGQGLGVCPSIAFRKRGSNNRVACGTRSPDLARLSDE
jgi:hypothetical protein